MENASWLHLFVLALATFRLTHLIVYDKITNFIRKPFIETIAETHGVNNEPEQVMHMRGSGLRRFIGTLLSCHWCSGIWCSIIVVLIYLYLPAGFVILVILAIAGAAAIIESFIP